MQPAAVHDIVQGLTGKRAGRYPATCCIVAHAILRAHPLVGRRRHAPPSPASADPSSGSIAPIPSMQARRMRVAGIRPCVPDTPEPATGNPGASITRSQP